MPPPIFGVDYKTPLGQKFVGYHYRLIQKAARITPQVEYQTLHALAAQTCQRPEQLDMRRARELRQTHVTDMTLAVEHKRRIDAVQLYGIAHYLYLDLVADALTAYRQTHVRTARSAQTLYDILLRYVAPCHERVVDTHDTVAGTHSRAVARPLGNDVHDNDRIGGRIEHYAYAVELAVERFVDLIELLGRNIYRVGIELVQQLRYDLLVYRVERNGVDIVILYAVDRLQQLVVGIHALGQPPVLGRGHHQPLHDGIAAHLVVCADLYAEAYARHGGQCQQHGHPDYIFRGFGHRLSVYVTPRATCS